jgi:hypothetical protein
MSITELLPDRFKFLRRAARQGSNLPLTLLARASDVIDEQSLASPEMAPCGLIFRARGRCSRGVDPQRSWSAPHTKRDFRTPGVLLIVG